MSTIVSIEQLVQALQSGVETLAKSTLNDFASQAKTDGKNAIDSMKTNLQKWTLELGSGALTEEDIAFLIKEQAALDEMTTLKQAGLAEIKIDQFKNNLINMFTNTIFSFIKI
jgi:hypothetical protein